MSNSGPTQWRFRTDQPTPIENGLALALYVDGFRTYTSLTLLARLIWRRLEPGQGVSFPDVLRVIQEPHTFKALSERCLENIPQPESRPAPRVAVYEDEDGYIVVEGSPVLPQPFDAYGRSLN